MSENINTENILPAPNTQDNNNHKRYCNSNTFPEIKKRFKKFALYSVKTPTNIILMLGLSLSIVLATSIIDKKNKEQHLPQIFLKQKKLDDEVPNPIRDKTENSMDIPMMPKRNLFPSINQSEYDKIVRQKEIYAFVKNLTILDYYGYWKNMYFSSNTLESATGNAVIEIKKTSNYYNNYLDRDVKFFIDLTLKDEKFVDNFIKIQIPITINQELKDTLHSILTNEIDSDYNINLEGIKLDIYNCQFLGDCEKLSYNNTIVKITFIKSSEVLSEKYRGRFNSSFSEINLNIKEKKEYFTLDLNGKIGINYDLTNAVRDYCFLLTLMGFLEIYFVSQNLKILQSDYKKAKGVDLITVLFSVITKVLIVTSHFYFTNLSKDGQISIYFGLPSIVYFLLLTIFEIRILFIVFKYYNSALYESNIEAYKTRFFQCALGLYFFLFIFLCISKLLLTHFPTCFALFFFTWVFQICFSAKNGIRPPMSYGHILCTSLSKMFLPIYFKAYPDNAFEMKPNIIKSLSTSGIVAFEVFILFLQKAYGSKIIIPSYFKKNTYTYFHLEDSMVQKFINKSKICSLCQRPFIRIDNINDDLTKEDFFIQKTKFLFIADCLKKIGTYQKSFKLFFQKKEFMVTPCSHMFHCGCLEKWIEEHNECPTCKKEIPLLD
ncbi:MAG: hypothetical protein MJ252_01895 [archaeon]|nr:hypothetical protein [archaeon]